MRIVVVTSVDSLRLKIRRALKTGDPTVEVVDAHDLQSAQEELAQHGDAVSAIILDTSTPAHEGDGYNSAVITSVSFLAEVKLTTHAVVTVSYHPQHRAFIRSKFGYSAYDAGDEMNLLATKTLAMLRA